jgi:hypothetical protein
MGVACVWTNGTSSIHGHDHQYSRSPVLTITSTDDHSTHDHQYSRLPVLTITSTHITNTQITSTQITSTLNHQYTQSSILKITSTHNHQFMLHKDSHTYDCYTVRRRSNRKIFWIRISEGNVQRTGVLERHFKAKSFKLAITYFASISVTALQVKLACNSDDRDYNVACCQSRNYPPSPIMT